MEAIQGLQSPVALPDAIIAIGFSPQIYINYDIYEKGKRRVPRYC